jgi:hypothetical protein
VKNYWPFFDRFNRLDLTSLFGFSTNYYLILLSLLNYNGMAFLEKGQPQGIAPTEPFIVGAILYGCPFEKA